jgi:hypothetical protein
MYQHGIILLIATDTTQWNFMDKEVRIYVNGSEAETSFGTA